MTSTDKNEERPVSVDARSGQDNYDLHFPLEIEQYERKIYDLKQLIEISKGLNSTLDYNTLIDSILLTCMGQMQLLKAGIFLKKGIGESQYFFHRNYKGFEIDHTIEYFIDASSGVIHFIGRQSKCYTLQELNGTVPDDQSMKIMMALNPMLIVPLMSKGTLNGILILGERINHREFSETEKEYLLNIASLAAIAIHNASLYEMATTDMMTKLKIHHFFQALVIEEMERAETIQRPLSLIMADIDHFKRVNDTYGHQAGDIIIVTVARIIKECIRQIDTASRYGGEEFALILPGTELPEARIVAERIRTSIEKERITYNDQVLSVTISLGVTQFAPGIDQRSLDFIERADRALYQSKNNGRNQVTTL